MADQITFYLASRMPKREPATYMELQLDAPAHKGYPAELTLSIPSRDDEGLTGLRMHLNSEQLEQLGSAIDHMVDHARKASSGHKLNEEVQAEKERALTEKEHAEEGVVLDMTPDDKGQVYVQEPYLDAARRLINRGDVVAATVYGNTGIRITLR